MKQNNYESKTHLTEETFRKLKANQLSIEEKLDALEHIAECILCADRFAESFVISDLLTTPNDFQSRVLKEIKWDDSHREVKTYAISKSKSGNNSNELNRKKKAFYFYVARVSLAMCISLMLLFSGTFGFMTNALAASTSKGLDLSKVDTFTENLREVSDKIVNMEVN